MIEVNETTTKYDLEERTGLFGEQVIQLCKRVVITPVNRSIVNQLIRSATSIGANYMEANGASSKKDFRNKIHICKKESQESLHWLRMLAKAEPDLKEQIRPLWQECKKLVLIFGKITSSLRS